MVDTRGLFCNFLLLGYCFFGVLGCKIDSRRPWQLPPPPSPGGLEVTVTPPEGPDGGQPLEPTLPTPEFGESEKLKAGEA